MNIILCGLPSSGKTTIGRRLSIALNRPFIDTDQLIEDLYPEKLSCREICKQKGEPDFRQLEIQAIQSLAAVKNSVISLGGGALMDHENQKIIANAGMLFYLKWPGGVIWNRLKNQGIPAYLDTRNPENHFDEIASARGSIFERAADVIIHADNLNEEEVILKILAHDRLSH